MFLHFVSLKKQARAGNVRGYLQIPKFPEDPELCLVRTLTAYFRKVRSVNFVLQIIYLCTYRCLGFVGTPSNFLYNTLNLTKCYQ